MTGTCRATLPLRDELRGKSPYGAPQLDVPVAAEHQRELLPAARAEWSPTDRERGGRGRPRAQPLPRPGRRRRCAPTWPRYLPAPPGTRSPAQRVGGQRLQRGPAAAAAGLRRPGPHRARLRRRPTRCTRSSPRHRHRLDRRARAATTSPSTRGGRGRARSREHRPDVVFLCSPEQPDRHGARRSSTVARAVRRRRPTRRAWWSSTRRTPSSAAGTPRALALLAAARGWWSRRTMSKAFALAGRGWATWRPTRRWSTPSSSSACRTTSRPSPRPPPAPRWPTPTRCWRRSTQLKAERDRMVAGLRGAGLTRWPTPTPTSCCSAASPTRHAIWQALLDRGVLVRDVGAAGLAAGHRRHPGRDRRVPRRALSEVAEGDRTSGMTPHDRRTRGAHDQGDRARRARPRRHRDQVEIAPVSASSTTCSTRSASTAASTSPCRPTATWTSTPTTRSRTPPSRSARPSRQALGDKAGIRRFGDAPVPLDEVAGPGGGRPVRPAVRGARRAGEHGPDDRRRRHDADPARLGVASSLRPRSPARHVLYGRNPHHMVEAQFKAVARALRDAVALDPRAAGRAVHQGRPVRRARRRRSARLALLIARRLPPRRRLELLALRRRQHDRTGKVVLAVVLLLAA